MQNSCCTLNSHWLIAHKPWVSAADIAEINLINGTANWCLTSNYSNNRP